MHKTSSNASISVTETSGPSLTNPVNVDEESSSFTLSTNIAKNVAFPIDATTVSMDTHVLHQKGTTDMMERNVEMDSELLHAAHSVETDLLHAAHSVETNILDVAHSIETDLLHAPQNMEPQNVVEVITAWTDVTSINLSTHNHEHNPPPELHHHHPHNKETNQHQTSSNLHPSKKTHHPPQISSQ
ncbi:hypothetical protein BC829DRAFT_104894 [Chytridium lagenaria]|nr:hypothetical protein BC829DRAFT_104894 [Chytridium lagenaria]